MWKRLHHNLNQVDNKDTSIFVKKMRYFISYPPMKAVRLIDVNNNVRVEDILQLVQEEFGLKVHTTGRSETSIVLNYNGFDLKPKWTFADISIPSGAMIRCIYKEQQAADLYVHCGFNNQLLKLLDSTINIESTISSIRKRISDQLGIPLSTFCLETYDGKHRLLDPMTLMYYDIKIHDHVYLKVWRGYEKFINSCIRGYVNQYSQDDLIRHYQVQVALYIAAFYGHVELASSVMHYGARNDRPVGEHPSRQWSFETIVDVVPASLKCPIHVAIERGQVKMVDLFVRQSILCTQVRDPITGLLPYQLALSYATNTKNKTEKQRFSEIYFYLQDKHFNVRIPLNANGDYVLRLLNSMATTNNTHRTSTHYFTVSLPLYCRIIRWYERAREKVWKKYGGHISSHNPSKRLYPEKGLLGYKVLIDGYNNTFEIPPEQLRNIRSGTSQSEISDRYAYYSDEEREKLIQMKTFMKQVALNDRRRAKKIAAMNLQQTRRPPLVLSRTSVNPSKPAVIITTTSPENVSSSSEVLNSQVASRLTAANLKAIQSISQSVKTSTNRSLHTQSIHPSERQIEQKSKLLQKPPTIAIIDTDERQTTPMTISNISNVSTTRSKLTHKQPPPLLMSSADAFLVSSVRLVAEAERNKAIKKRELFSHIEKTLQRQDQQLSEVSSVSTNLVSQSLLVDRHTIIDVNPHIPLHDHPIYSETGPIQSHHDLRIRQSTFRPYERYASASLRSTAVTCLEEATYFKRKSWLKQVEMSKDMVKQKVHRRIGRADDKTMTNPTLVPLHANHTTKPCKSKSLQAQ